MSIKHGTPNPLNYFGIRRVEFAAPHFKYITIAKYNALLIEQLDEWIQYNLNHRFYLGPALILNETNTLIYATKIGFEVESEISIFNLTCPLI